jgi:hypothetical protein
VSTSTTYTPWSQVAAAAMAYAARLDVLLAETRDEALENALLAVGDLLGGLSIHGFAGDLRMHLERVEADLLEDAPRHECRGARPDRGQPPPRAHRRRHPPD